jgi:hypothetical protein
MIKFLRKLISFWPRNWRATPSYHDLYITTAQIPRTSIFNLPYNLRVDCTRIAGWQLWDSFDNSKCLAGEYDANWLVLDVAGFVIVDGREGNDD